MLLFKSILYLQRALVLVVLSACLVAHLVEADAKPGRDVVGGGGSLSSGGSYQGEVDRKDPMLAAASGEESK